MKLRVYGQSIRFRLSQTEVQQLADGQCLSQTTPLFPQPLVCQLRPSAKPTAPQISFNAGQFEVTLDQRQLSKWAQSSDVSINGIISHEGQEAVRLLIEKDFKCLHGDGENQEGVYPNPLSVTPK